ncbi:hypothetical protein SESBI_42431 [Sesbania bispinosa]|nr:hypothetical protein SESBI_42431 [Sesbania bispinosa]
MMACGRFESTMVMGRPRNSGGHGRCVAAREAAMGRRRNPARLRTEARHGGSGGCWPQKRRLWKEKEEKGRREEAATEKLREGDGVTEVRPWPRGWSR